MQQCLLFLSLCVLGHTRPQEGFGDASNQKNEEGFGDASNPKNDEGFDDASNKDTKEGFGDATNQEIEQIREGKFLDEFNENPEYNFNYKVADEEEQTYIAMSEGRQGDTVSGSYQYVDPLGSLITVTYSAGPQGYTETRDIQKNFVTIRARPKRLQQSVSSVNALASAEAHRVAAQRQEARRQRLETEQTLASGSASGLNSHSELVTQIVAEIQPLVSGAVSSAVQRPTGTAAPSPPSRFSPRPSPAPALTFPSRVPLPSVSLSVPTVTVSRPIPAVSVSRPISTVNVPRPISTLNVPRLIPTDSAPLPPIPTVSVPRPLPTVSAPRPISGVSVQRPIGRVRVPANTINTRVSPPSSSDLGAVFGQGGNYNVRFNTPDFTIEY